MPSNVKMKELVENLKIRNSEAKGARSQVKAEMESVLVEFEIKEVLKEIFCGFIRFSV